jgi:hypothetical protein
MDLKITILFNYFGSSASENAKSKSNVLIEGIVRDLSNNDHEGAFFIYLCYKPLAGPIN